MEKQTNKELEDEIERLIREKTYWVKDKDGLNKYAARDYKKLIELKAELKGRKDKEKEFNDKGYFLAWVVGERIREAMRGMIKIEDVNKMIDKFDFAERHNISETINEETIDEMDKRLKKELKQSLKKLGEK